jgi:hypothetical protein
LIQDYIFKVICIYDNFIHSNIAAAIILEADYKHEINFKKFSYFGINYYPYDMVNYQLFDFIEEKSPRLAAVGICLQYGSQITTGISNWIQFHKNFQVDKIIMHDGSPTRTLGELINWRNLEKL